MFCLLHFTVSLMNLWNPFVAVINGDLLNAQGYGRHMIGTDLSFYQQGRLILYKERQLYMIKYTENGVTSRWLIK